MTNKIIDAEIDVVSCIAKTQLLVQDHPVFCAMKIQPWSPETFNRYLSIISDYEFVDLDTWYKVVDAESGIALETIGKAPSKFHKLSDDLTWEPDFQSAWDHVRTLRAGKLVSSDWTQLPDVPLATKEAWATYRQALRDITQQSDPFNITWPVPPQ